MPGEAWHAAVRGDMEWFKRHNEQWRAFGEAIVRGEGVKRTLNEMEAHLGQEWAPPGGHGTYDED